MWGGDLTSFFDMAERAYLICVLHIFWEMLSIYYQCTISVLAHRLADDNDVILLPLIVIDYSGLQLCIRLTLALLTVSQQAGINI